MESDADAKPSAPLKLSLDLLKHPERIPDLKPPACNLRQEGGAGYELFREGQLAKARLSKAVRDCHVCYGEARIVEGNSSRPCFDPSPVRVVNHINNAHIPAKYCEARLADFRNDTGNGRQFLKQLDQWLGGFDPKHNKARGMVITGPVGVGKTFVLASLAKLLAERDVSVRFTDFFQLLGQLKAGFAEGKADSALLEPLINVDVLLIDELGKGRGRDFDLTVLDQLVCGRYNMGKTIIASTNYQLVGAQTNSIHNQPLDVGFSQSSDFSPEQFGLLENRIGSRIFSRLREMCHFFELTGDDFRKHMQTPAPSSYNRQDDRR